MRTNKGEEVECKIKGVLFKKSRYDNQIAVGDKVRFKRDRNDSVGLIVSIDTRKSFLSRNRVGIDAEQVIAANIDYLLIVAAAKNPPFRANLVNRMLVAATVGNITPVLVITKTDLVEGGSSERLVEPYRDLDLETVFFSIKATDHDPRLLEILTNSVSVLAGQSGVGKSSLLNTLFPALSIKVGAVSHKTRKGSHTTTYAMMHQISENSYVIDTPGIREFGLWKITQRNLGQYYPAISGFQYDCKHRDCKHVHEPKCAVKKAVETNDLDENLYQGYVSIYRSLENNQQR
ncbi:MAG: ribosome small subunit-dependent GTPase A [Proteobacteria bacterium]|nr:ribosome small subunit-dependent GTPase A [Pseudomonadota bacterium]